MMATNNNLRIGNYVVFLDNQLGRGGFGTVYKAISQNGASVAAKRISTRNHRQENIPELINFHNRPACHANIVECYETIREGNNLWLFMEFCENGDLDRYMRNNYQTLNITQKYDIMVQIAKGLEYLHGQDIVHRDIKPNNILISGGDSLAEVVAKIGDFGIAKYLDPNGETSAMSTTVGTFTFKAPEFWQRSPQGKVSYHRSIDVFSTGLTFLSMLQCSSANPLHPTIENTMDIPDESQKPIGLIMFLREQNNQTSVNVVAGDPNDDELTAAVKDTIRKMTRMIPEHRMRAEEIVLQLEQDLLLNIPVATQLNDANSRGLQHDASAYRSPHLQGFGAIANQEQRFPLLTASKLSGVKLDPVAWQNSRSCLTMDGNMVLCGKEDPASMVQLFWCDRSGKLLKKAPAPECGHGTVNGHNLLEVNIRGFNYIAAACDAPNCGQISLYNPNTRNTALVYRARNEDRFCPGAMTHGPQSTVIAVNNRAFSHTLAVLDITNSEIILRQHIPCCIDVPNSIVFTREGLVIASKSTDNIVCATSLSSGQTVWVTGIEPIAGNLCEPHGLALDQDGRLFIADGDNSRVVILKASTGALLQTLMMPDLGKIIDISWNQLSSQITVRHNVSYSDKEWLSTYQIQDVEA